MWSSTRVFYEGQSGRRTRSSPESPPGTHLIPAEQPQLRLAEVTRIVGILQLLKEYRVEVVELDMGRFVLLIFPEAVAAPVRTLIGAPEESVELRELGGCVVNVELAFVVEVHDCVFEDVAEAIQLGVVNARQVQDTCRCDGQWAG